jgi:release factor glutamine methyltransferase
MLDLFAGSGCIGIAVLTHVPNAAVDFGELESKHLATIQKNIEVNNIDLKRTKIIETDVYSTISDTYDFILANPPYLSPSRIERIQDSVLSHEPHNALFADEEGFALIRRTLEGVPAHLNPGGHVWVEHEPEHSASIKELTQHLGASAQTMCDQYGVERYSVILYP